MKLWEINEDILNFIASRIKSNIRRLEPGSPKS